MRRFFARSYRITLTAALVLALECTPLAFLGKAYAANPTLTVNGAQHFQTMDGFGTSINSASWMGGQLKPALDQLIAGGNTNWRVIIDNTDWETTNDDSDPNNFNWAYYNTIYSSPKFQDLWSTIGYLNSKGFTGKNIIINFMGPGPAWLGGDTLMTDSTSKDEWVEMISSLAYYARNTAQVQFGMLAPVNEPDWQCTMYHEGMCISAATYADIMDRLSTKLDSIGMSDVHFVGPDNQGVANGLNSYLPQMYTKPNLMAKMDHYTFHDYSGDTHSADSVIKASAYPNKTFWMDEYSPFSGGFSMIGQGATSIMPWDGYDSVYNHAILHGGGSTAPNDAAGSSSDLLALLAYNSSTGIYTPRKQYYQSAQLFKFVPAGSVRIGASESATGVTTYAFSDPASGRVTIVGSNTSASSVTFAGTLSGLGNTVSSFQYYTTNTGSANLLRGTDVPVSANAFSAVAPANTVFTLTALTLPDTTAPSAPTSLTASAVNTNQVNLGWNASTDNVGVTGYTIKRDGTAIGTSATNSYTDTTTVANTSYTYTVSATDAAGNTSGASNQASVTTPIVPPLTAGTAVSTDQSTAGTSITSPTFTAHPGDLVTAFLSSKGSTSSTVSFNTPTTTGLTWTLRKRVNPSGSGTAEIWTAVAPAGFTSGTVSATRNSGSFQGSVSVVAFSGADTTAAAATGSASGTNSAPSTSLTTTRAGSWVWGVGDDVTGSTSRTLGTNQTLVHQFTKASTGTFWSQRQTNPTATPGVVTLNDTAPSTTDRWNMAALEILPQLPPGDTTPPVISNTAVSNLTEQGSTVSWNTDEAATSVVNYGLTTSYGSTATNPALVTAHSLNLTSLAAGTTYHYQVRSADAAGNIATSADATFSTPDVTPPSTPQSISATALSTTQAQVSWAASTDNVGVNGYQVWRDGSQMGSVNGSTTVFVDSGLTPGQTYSYTVVATDAAGNTSAQSAPASVTLPVPDTTAPTAPANLVASNVGLNAATISWDAATDDTGVTGYQIWRSDNVATPVGTVSGNVLSYTDTSLQSNTTYTYTVKASDAAGNTSDASAPLDVTTLIDLQAPSAPGNIAFSNVTTSTVTISWDASVDNVGVVGYQISRSDAPDGTFVAVGNTTSNTQFTDSGLQSGVTYYYSIRALDAQGNYADSAVVSATTAVPDTTPPAVPTSVAASSSSFARTHLTWNASIDSSGIGYYTIWRNGTALTTTTGLTYDDNGLTPGQTYSYTVTATDTVGNTSAQSDPASVTLPTVSLTAPAAGATVSGTATVTANTVTGVAGVQFKLDGANLGTEDTSAPYSTSWDTTTATNGAHSLAATARDSWGNTMAITSVSVTVANIAPSLALDVNVSGDVAPGNTIPSPTFSTASTNELLVALIESSGPGSAQTIKTVTGGSLTWTMRQRANTRFGTAEIWTAPAAAKLTNVSVVATPNTTGYSGSITILSYTGASLSGIGAIAKASATTGLPSVSLTTTKAGSIILAAGNDWDGANARTVGSGQTLVHQYIQTTTGDTFWNQRLTAVSTSVGQSVTLNDIAPTPSTHQWNLAAVEILPLP